MASRIVLSISLLFSLNSFSQVLIGIDPSFLWGSRTYLSAATPINEYMMFGGGIDLQTLPDDNSRLEASYDSLFLNIEFWPTGVLKSGWSFGLIANYVEADFKYTFVDSSTASDNYGKAYSLFDLSYNWQLGGSLFTLGYITVLGDEQSASFTSGGNSTTVLNPLNLSRLKIAFLIGF
jgi:hypothetical protein